MSDLLLPLDTTPVAPSIRVGPAGWSYRDWEGPVYPPHGSRFDPLSWLARWFDTIEVNSSFYRIPPPQHAKSWARRVAANPDFRFAVKLYRGFTHEPEGASSAEVDEFRRFLDPLLESGRFGALLMQFPWSFKREDDADRRLARLFRAFPDVPSVVEVRHGSFQQEDFYRFLDDERIGFANIDQPVFGDSIRPSGVVTGPVGYIRLHGRNYQKWFAHEEAWERYDYLYSREELQPWVERAREMSRKKEVMVITNNHFRGKAVVNALEMKQELGQTVEIPRTIAEAYPGRFPAR